MAAGVETELRRAATRARAEPADGDARAVDGQRRDDRMEARAVGEAGVDHRRCAVEPQPERRDDALDEAQDPARVEREGHWLEPAGALDERAVRAR